jgi:hypothetical protein
MHEFVMGTDGKVMCINLLGAYSSLVAMRIVPRSLEEAVLVLWCPSDADAAVLNGVLGVLIPLI